MFSDDTLFIGIQKLHLKTVQSTNAYALDLISKSKPPEGMVVIADNQTQGRGQMGSKWVSAPDKDATFSIVLYPIFLSPSATFLLNKVISLGVAKAIENLGIEDVYIKWPNDIYIGNGKLGGILIQTTVSSTSILTAVCGIGLNVNEVDFDPSLPNPVSLKTVSGRNFSPDEVMSAVFKQIEVLYLQLKSGKTDNLDRLYEENLLGYQTTLQFKDRAGRLFQGKVLGVDKKGRLILEKVEGQVTYDLKELSWCLK